jgi:hypothetical protein
MITNLLKECYAKDIELWTEDGKLRFRAEQGALTEELKQRLIDNKIALILQLEQNQFAKDADWIVFEFGDFEFIVHKGKAPKLPFAETPTHYIVMGLDRDLDKASRIAVKEAIDFSLVANGYVSNGSLLTSQLGR